MSKQQSGRAVSNEDQMLFILAGIGLEFELTIHVRTSKMETYNIQTTSALVLSSEQDTLITCCQ